MSEALPFIYKKETKKSLNGDIIESKELTVQGTDLDQCQKVHKEKWKEK